MKKDKRDIKESKKAISPVVATVLLIVLVVIIALIIFLWARSFIKESVTKLVGSQEITGEEACGMLSFEATYTETTKTIDLLNNGNIPIYAVNVKYGPSGTKSVKQLVIDLGSGAGMNRTVAEIQTGDTVSVIPLIIGKSNDNYPRYVCEDKEMLLN